MTGGSNKDNKLHQQQQMLGNLQQPLFQPLVKPVDAPTNELIRMLQAPQRINEKDSDLGLNGNNNNKNVNQVSHSTSGAAFQFNTKQLPLNEYSR